MLSQLPPGGGQNMSVALGSFSYQQVQVFATSKPYLLCLQAVVKFEAVHINLPMALMLGGLRIASGDVTSAVNVYIHHGKLRSVV